MLTSPCTVAVGKPVSHKFKKKKLCAPLILLPLSGHSIMMGRKDITLRASIPSIIFYGRIIHWIIAA